MDKKKLRFINKFYSVKNKFQNFAIFLLIGIIILLIDYFKVANSTIVCTIAVVLAVFFEGFIYGIICSIITLLYSAYFFSENHSFILYTNEHFYKVIVNFITLMIIISIVGILKQKQLKQTNKLEAMNQLLYNKTIFDELSGLYNYRHFTEQLKKIWSEGIEKSSTISLAMIDIDFFKKYNDYYGHQKGNECISEISSILSATVVRENGFVARYGGEEFVIIFPDTEAKEAKRIADNIRLLVEKKKIEHKASELYRYITISIGIAAMMPTKDTSQDMLINRADYVLYEAKNTGRNRVLEEDDIDTRANIRKSDGRYIFPKEQQEAYERLILPLGVFQLVDDNVITLLVSDGLCEMAGSGRVELTEHFNSNMFGNVHPEDVEQIAKSGYLFARGQCEYDVIYRTRFFENKYHTLHVVGKFQTVTENIRVAFLVYTEMFDSTKN